MCGGGGGNWLIHGPKKKDIAASWIKLHNEELMDIYSSTHIVRVMRWTELVAFMVQKISSDSFGGGNQEERGHFANLGVEGKIGLSVQSRMWRCGLD
jgi:hypothetical protein